MGKGASFLLTVVLCALGLRGADAMPSLVGIWFSPFQPDEPNVMSLIEFRADGTFREEFRKCDGGRLIGYQTESGTWSIDGDIERTVADRVNGRPDRVENRYTILLLTETERHIRMEPQGHLFVSLRVKNFEFPPCATPA